MTSFLILFAVALLIVIVVLNAKRTKNINSADSHMSVKEEIILMSVHCVIDQSGSHYDTKSIIELANGYEFDFLVYGRKNYLTVFHRGIYLKLQFNVFGQKRVRADMTEAEFKKSFEQSARDIQSDNNYSQSLFCEEGYRTLHYEDPDTGDTGLFYFKEEQLVCFVIFDARAN